MPRKPRRPPTPPPSTGSAIYPGDDWQAKIDAAPAGAILIVRTGLHQLRYHVTLRSGMKLLGEAGTVVDGGGGPGGVRGYPTVADVELAGMTFRNFINPYTAWPRAVIHTGLRWRVGVRVEGCNQVGIEANTGARIIGSTVEGCSRYGIAGGPGSDIVIEDTHLLGNNTARYDWNDDAGGTKLTKVRGLVFRRCHVVGNHGNGLWADWENADVVYEDNHVAGNAGCGIYHEVSQNAVIVGNTLINNGSLLAGKSLWWGAQVYLFDSEHVVVERNVIDGGVGGVGIRDQDRGMTSFGASKCSDIIVRDNDVTLRVAAAQVGVVSDRSPWSAGIHFQANRYRTVSNAAAWQWQGANRDFPGWRTFGHDTAGTLSAV